MLPGDVRSGEVPGDVHGDVTGDVPSRDLWCQYALLPTGVASGVLISIEDGLIVGVDAGLDETPAGAEHLDGLTMPGFANAHSHAFHRALRGRTHGNGRGGDGRDGVGGGGDGRGGDFWTWRQEMYAVAGRLTPENLFDLARATFAEMVLAGYTCVGEFHYVHHRPDGSRYDQPNAMGDALVRAAEAAGIRLTLLDACYLRSAPGTDVTDQQRGFSDGTAQAWADRVDLLSPARTTRIGAAIHSVRALDAAAIEAVAAHAASRSMVLHAHVSEQPAENEMTMAEHGCSPTDVLADAGALSPRFTAVHATHLRVDDVHLFGASGASCCFCPTTERDLADGIGPSSELCEAGVPLTIGSDQQAVIDPFEEMRALEMDERLRSLRRGTHSAGDLLAMASANGYRCLGWDEGGAIAIGCLADLTTVGLDSVRLAGAARGALADAVVFAATASDVTHVIVAGRSIVIGGVHVSIDVGAALRDAVAAVQGSS